MITLSSNLLGGKAYTREKKEEGLGTLAIKDISRARFTRRDFMSFLLLSWGIKTYSPYEPFLQKAYAESKGGDKGSLFLQIRGLSPEITPNDKFYYVSKNIFDPKVPLDRYRLNVKGLVDRPLSLDLKTIKGLPWIERYVTLECISNEVGGSLMGNALWRGIRLRDILIQAKVRTGARDLIFKGYDDYTDSIPLEKGMDEDTFLAYTMNGLPLSHEHGAPLRAIVPGIYGMKNVKWLTGIEVVDYDYEGYWQEQGWSDKAEIRIFSRIDVPKNGSIISPGKELFIAGIAFGGISPIKEVEISIDSGRNWQKANVKEKLSPFSLVLWAYDWKIGKERGKQNIMVRGKNLREEIQEGRQSPPLPNGATGYHQIEVTVGG